MGKLYEELLLIPKARHEQLLSKSKIKSVNFSNENAEESGMGNFRDLNNIKVFGGKVSSTEMVLLSLHKAQISSLFKLMKTKFIKIILHLKLFRFHNSNTIFLHNSHPKIKFNLCLKLSCSQI